jgi:hypothetical protein
MFCITFECYHLNPAQTRTLSVLPDPGPGSCRPLPLLSPRLPNTLASPFVSFSLSVRLKQLALSLQMRLHHRHYSLGRFSQ